MATERFIIQVTTRGTAQAGRAIRGIGREANSTRRLLGFLRAALVVFASVAILRGLSNFVDVLTRMNNRLRLVTGSARELATVQAALFKISIRTRTEMEANADLFSKLARTTQNLRLTYGELLDITEAVALATKISGEETATAANGLRQFGQALASGVLGGDELRSVTENLTRLATVIGKEFGIAGDQLRKFGTLNPGVITTVRIIKAIRGEFGQLGDELKQTKFTIGDAFTNFNTRLTIFLGGLAESVSLGTKVNTVLEAIARKFVQIALALAAFAGVLVFNILIGQIASLNSKIFVLGALIFSSITGIARLATVLIAPWTLLTVVLTGVGGLVATVFSPLTAAVVLLFGVTKAVTKGFLAMAVAVRTVGISAVASATALKLLLLPVVALRAAFIGLALAVAANPLFIIGAVVVGSLIAGFILFRKEIDAVIQSLGGFKGIMDIVLAASLATINIIIPSWRDLPAVAGDVGVRVANAFIGSMNRLIAVLNGSALTITKFFDNVLAHTTAAAVFVFRGLEALSAFLKLQFAKAINPIIESLNALGRAAEFVLNSLGKDTKFDPIQVFDLIQMEKDVKGISSSLADFDKALADINKDSPIGKLVGQLGQFNLLVNTNAGAAASVAQKWVDEFDRIKAANPTDFLIEKFKGVADFLKSLLGDNLEIDQSILDLFAKIAGGGVTGNLSSLSRAAGSLIASISPLAAATIKTERAQKLLNEAATAGIDIFAKYGITGGEVLRRVTRNIIGVGNATTNFYEGQTLLNLSLATGVINANEYAKAVRELRLTFLDTQTGAMAGFERGILRIVDTTSDLASAIADGIGDAFESATDSLIDFVKTGKFNITSLVDTIITQLARIAIQNAIVGPLAAAFSNLFAPGGAGAAPGSFRGAQDVGIAHSGGIVGSSGMRTRSVSSHVFDNAQRLHGGGFALGRDEVPTILQRGELVLTKKQQGERGKVELNVNITNNAGADVKTNVSEGPGGKLNLEVLIDEGAAVAVNTPGSATQRALQSSMGLGRRPINRG